jgi:hypothetical protein
MSGNGNDFAACQEFCDELGKSSRFAVAAHVSYINFLDNKSGLGAPVLCREAKLFP